MQAINIDWTTTEEVVARKAFDIAYKREIGALIDSVRYRASSLAEIDDMWRLHDFLSVKRHEVDGRYDYRLSTLIFVFAGLVKDGWLNLNELEGLNVDKIAKIAALTCM
jgi:Photoprotection regulator fluorescence recovery protein